MTTEVSNHDDVDISDIFTPFPDADVPGEVFSHQTHDTVNKILELTFDEEDMRAMGFETPDEMANHFAKKFAIINENKFMTYLVEAKIDIDIITKIIETLKKEP